MEMPTKLDILGVDTKIQFAELTDRYGQYDAGNSKIEIIPGMDGTMLRLILTHEMVHAIEHLSGFELREKQVWQLASGLYDTMRHNKDAFRWILEA